MDLPKKSDIPSVSQLPDYKVKGKSRMVVYLIRNLANGKVYVGKTTKTSAFRWTYHLNNAKRGVGFPLYRALRKYGPDSFKVEDLYEAKTGRELNAMETFFIVMHQSNAPGNGYNLTLGGDGAAGYKQTEEHRRKIRESIKALGPQFGESIRQAKLGVPLSEAHCEAIGDSKRGIKNPNFGKPRDPVTCLKIALGNSGKTMSLLSRDKMRAAKEGKLLTEQHCASLKARWTPELRAAQALRMQKQREANGGKLCL